MKILMVCLGNICRSPLAEGIMRNKIEAAGLDWTVDSAGTGNWHIGEQPDRRSIEVAQHNGLDISEQRARQFRAQDLDEYDLILAMDRNNYRDILRLAKTEEQKKKVHLIMDLAKPGDGTDVPDPYWDDNGFAQVYRMLEDACERIVEHYQATPN